VTFSVSFSVRLYAARGYGFAVVFCHTCARDGMAVASLIVACGAYDEKRVSQLRGLVYRFRIPLRKGLLGWGVLWCVLSADALFLDPGSCVVVASGADGEWVPVVRGSW
jgi:hypothetical protein